MNIVGFMLLLIGFITGVVILWSIGMVLLFVGIALWILGSLGHAVGGLRRYSSTSLQMTDQQRAGSKR